MAVVTYIKQHISTANASSYIFSSTSTGGANDIGATASDRQVILGGFLVATTSATRTISSMAVNATTATAVVTTNGTRSSGTIRAFTVGIANALLATATSVAITLTATTTVAGAGMTVWSATHVGASAATYGWTFASASGGWATASAATMGATVAAGEFAVVEEGTLLGLTSVWTNVTSRHETNSDLSRHIAADGSGAFSTIGVVMSATNSFMGAVFAVFSDNTPVGTAETLYRTFLPAHCSPVGRRPLMVWYPV